MGRCVLREWVVGGRELGGCCGEQGLPVGIQESLEGCVVHRKRQFVPKWDSRNGEGELATASLLVKLVYAAA